MKLVTFALYPQYPISCEGNDDPAQIRALTLQAHASEHIQEKAERVAAKIAQRYSCHAQVWDIATD